ncbi:MAG TPA: hypothetical protein VK456_03180 [Xanthobacteraceae bacterium]|nr:hypothetical protein [Xanthobacteraceae bacterium]
MLNIWKRSARKEFPYKVPKPAVPIVSDAAIATDAIGDGRFIPVVIMDTSARPDIAELISIHDKAPPGDVVSAWGSILDGPRDHLALFLHFQRPMELSFALNFDLSRQGSIVELALRSRAIFLQAGKLGDRLYRTLDAPRMIAELGGGMPKERWDDLWAKAIKRRLRTEGLSNGEAKRAAIRFIEEMRSRFRNAKSFETGIFIDAKRPTTNDAEAARQGS